MGEGGGVVAVRVGDEGGGGGIPGPSHQPQVPATDCDFTDPSCVGPRVLHCTCTHTHFSPFCWRWLALAKLAG